MRISEDFRPNIALHSLMSSQRGIVRQDRRQMDIGIGPGKVCLMARTLVAWITIGLAAMAAGCRMCDNSYDYCDPTFIGGCHQQCCPTTRAGSILSGTFWPGTYDSVVHGDAPGDAVPYYDGVAYDEPHSAVILSESDEKIHKIRQDTRQVTEDRPVQSQGWTPVKSP